MRALLIGNSDGIGLATTRRLLAGGWDIAGISKSLSPITDEKYRHHIMDVTDSSYSELIREINESGPMDVCIYCAGIGELLDPLNMENEVKIFEVNLTGLIRTAAAVIPGMVKTGKGHFMGISSFADELLSSEAPSYHASKAGFSNYLEGLALAVKPKGVYITNVRFGFVDTKMAKGERRPFMMSVERSADHLEICIRKKPVRYSAPRIVIPFIKFRKMMMKLTSH